jgi:hypothetical protein
MRKQIIKRTPGGKRPTVDKRVDKFGEGLHAFASKAYFAALRYYAKHHNDPAALAAFTRALRVGKERTR